MRFFRMAPLTGGAAVCVWSVLAGSANAASAVILAPHRAVYDLMLDRADEKSGISGLSGRMVYEFNGSACEGYTTNFRFVTRIDMDEQPQRLTDQQTATFESGDGKEFRFVNKTFVDKELIKEVRGDATLDGKKTVVELSKPKESRIDLRATQFPTTHMEELIGKAEAGEKFYQTTLFDASEDADRVVATTVVVGKAQEAKNEEAKVMGPLTDDHAWPVTIAYFDDKEKQDGLPIYRINFKLYRNGITRDLTMDYGDFSMHGKLVKLDVFDTKGGKTACE
ncbi:cell envelope integrity protein EipB [Falsochrobactrum sp. TDYN1]|uniref:Cell envelope integrity protein EipB n=1 Tax=Falsochrobactrum tianjinense TaxID=2706015 RepID=A0A949PNQ0_9HYPH|nr:cell envelope integrity protein EipB [Falsochrobactrum sp. TDYN1]MBV2144607.1 cell envelope integrity protein EipB [Falsochrobactrum sp. TDYN1]